MADLLTKCPSCAVTFRVTTAQQAIANGQVRCSNCQQAFLAAEYAIAKQEMSEDGIVNTPIADDELLIYDEMPVPEDSSASSSTEDNNRFIPPSPQSLLEEPQLPPTTTPSRRQAVGYSLLCFALLLLLIGQYAHTHAVQLAQHSFLTTPLNRLCQLSGCSTLYRNRAELKTRNFSVTSHPAKSNALLMEGQLVNLGAYPQSYPQLHIAFEDLDGKVIAQRLFEPHEYLGEKHPAQTPLLPRQAETFHLSVVDPGSNAQSYTLLIH